MIKILKGNYIYFCLLIFIFVVSFYFYSPVSSPLYNSDNAIHVLMAYHLELPNDFYYWRQDRLGSLVPIVSHPLIKAFNMESIFVVSIVQYLFLAIIYFTFSSILKRKFSKILLAIILFLPLSPFPELIQIGHPYTPSLLFTGVVIFILNKYNSWSADHFDYKMAATLSLSGLFLFLSLWSSELSIATVAPVVLYVLYLLFFHRAEFSVTSDTKDLTFSGQFKIHISKKASFKFAAFITGAFFALYFIHYAKTHAIVQKEYDAQWLGSLQEIREILIRYFSNYLDIITFKTGDIYLGISLILFSLIIPILIYYTYKLKDQTERMSPWFYVFLLASFLYFMVVTLSHWVYLNEMPSRFSSGLYFITFLATLLYIERFDYQKIRIVYLLILSISFFTALNSCVRFIYPIHQRGMYQTYKSIKSLSPSGLIGSYWTSYMMASFHPSELIVTPGENGGFVRNHAMVDSISKQKTVYLIKEFWIDDFPEKIKQFGYWYTKKGEAFTIGNFTLAPYTPSRLSVNDSNPRKLIYPAPSLPTLCNNTDIASDDDGDLAYTINDTTITEPCFVIFGPYRFFNKGKYKVNFIVKISEVVSDDPIVKIDLYSDGKYLATRDLSKSDFAEVNKYQTFTLEIDSMDDIEKLETRVSYFGKGRLWVKKIEIETID